MYNNQFVLTFPDEWKETTVFTYEGPRENGITRNLTLMVDQSVTGDTDLESYVSGRVDMLRQTMPEFELLSEKEVMISGHEARVILYKYIPSEQFVLYQKQYYLFNRKLLFMFTSTFNKKTLALSEPEIDEIVSTLKILDEREVELLLSE